MFDESFDESFDEYIRSILGYPSTSMGRNMYGIENTMTPMGNTMSNTMSTAMPSTMSNSELESCYPEIYKVVYPMVSTACRNNTRPITKELVDNMTNEIYFAIEGNDNVTINLQTGDTNIPVQNRNSSNMNTVNNKNTAESKKEDSIPVSSGENRGEDRQFGQIRNRTLRDLIRILIIRELLGRPGFPGNRPPIRPPFPGRPPRPPMRPPFSGGSGGRPPMMPRSDFNNYYDIYEN